MAVETLVGNNTVLCVNTGTSESPTFVPVGFQRGLSYERTREMIDASHKGSDHAKNVYGRMSGTMSMDALVPNPELGAQATHEALEDAMNAKETILVQRVTNSGPVEVVHQAEALIGTISSEYPDNDVSTISLEFTLQEPLTLVDDTP